MKESLTTNVLSWHAYEQSIEIRKKRLNEIA